MPIEGDAFAIAKVLRKGRDVHNDSDDVGERILVRLRRKLNRVGRGALYDTYFFTDKAGKVHPIGHREPPHRASAPGDPPAPDTHELQASYEAKKIRLPAGSAVEIGSPLKRAGWLEFGTKNMQARPHVRPTILEMWGTISKPWADGITKRERAEARRLGGRG